MTPTPPLSPEAERVLAVALVVGQRDDTTIGEWKALLSAARDYAAVEAERAPVWRGCDYRENDGHLTIERDRTTMLRLYPGRGIHDADFRNLVNQIVALLNGATLAAPDAACDHHYVQRVSWQCERCGETMGSDAP